MNEKHDTASRVTALVLEQFDEVKPATIDPIVQFSDLGLDWLACIQLVMALEEEFGIVISDEDAQNLVSVQTVVSYLQTHPSR